MNESSFKTRILLCFTAVIALSLFIPGWYIRNSLREEGIQNTIQSAEHEVRLLGVLLAAAPAVSPENLSDLLGQIEKSVSRRVTFIDKEGKVLAESDREHTNIFELDNHADRIEIMQAAREGLGVSIRHSNTLDMDFVYVAIPFSAVNHLPAGFLRIAAPLGTIDALVARSEWQWGGVMVLSLILGFLLACKLSARLERSLREMIRVVEGIAIDATGQGLNRRRLHILPGKEFRPLARAVNDMADRTEEHLRTIAGQKAQLETILNSMDEGVLVVGTQGRVTRTNPALIRFFPQAAEGIGRMPVESIPIPELQQSLKKLAESPSEYGEAGLSLDVEPAPDMALSVRLSRARVEDPEITAVAVFHDMSKIARLMRMRREFVANVSHELRTPLTSIIGFAETLSSVAPDDPNHSRFTETILRNARHMAEMVEDLIQLSRIESGSVPMELRPVKAGAVLGEVMVASQPLAAGKGIHLVSDVDLELKVQADPHFLGQVFRNMIENAVRYAPEDSIVRITAQSIEETATFCVADEGPGIPESDLERIFERFYRVEKHRSHPASTGLGLSICKHIVERHGGRIWAMAGPGGRILFTIPVSHPAAF